MSDLHIGPDLATDEERELIDEWLARHGGPVERRVSPRMILAGSAAARSRRNLLLPLLNLVQNHSGWVSPGAANHLAEVLGVPPAEVFGVAGFYHLISTEPPPDNGGAEDVEIHVCDDVVCAAGGSARLAEELARAGGRVKPSPCLGRCESPPAVLIRRRGRPDMSVAGMDPSEVAAVARSETPATEPRSAPTVVSRVEGPSLVSRVGAVDPTSLDDYLARGGYAGLERALEIGPEAVIAAVTASGLAGRGGAAFPTGRKWAAVAGAPAGPREVVANADESEPGTFKDRVLMEGDPFALIEGLTIAGWATGARRGWIYLRGEYPEAAGILERALAAARAGGHLGAGLADRGVDFEFDIELRIGAGAYICGEETALFNSIEGYRGEPRNKPPYPTVSGLFGHPTAVNNVETLVNVPLIVASGARADTKLFPVSGAVARPGLYEMPLGTTLGELLDAAGGPAPGTSIGAILIGGAAGSFVAPDALELELSVEATRAAGVGLGSGAVVVFEAGRDMASVLERITRFFREESCGQCVPCRVGTVRQHEIVRRLAAGSGDGVAPGSDLDLLDDLAAVMGDASICGLGHTAAGALRSARALGLLRTGPDRNGGPR